MSEQPLAGQIFAFKGDEQPFVLPKVDLKRVHYRLFSQTDPPDEVAIEQPVVVEDDAALLSGAPYWSWRVPATLPVGEYKLHVDYTFPGPNGQEFESRAIMEIVVVAEQMLQAVPPPADAVWGDARVV